MTPNQPDDPYLVRLGELNGKVDVLLKLREEDVHSHKDFDDRIGKLENSRSWLLGVCAAAGAGASYLLSLIKGT